MKRRHDLIPNLVAAVKGEMQFEQDTLEKVIAARNTAVAARGVADAAEKENALTQSLSRLFALAENYPTLKANENVKTLMEELASTENRIGFARQFYNDIATRFNTAQQVFPDNFIAQTFKFQPVELFQIRDEAERAVPKVDLSIRSDRTACLELTTSTTSKGATSPTRAGSSRDSSCSSSSWASAPTASSTARA